MLIDTHFAVYPPPWCYAQHCLNKQRTFRLDTPGRRIICCPYHFIDAIATLPDATITILHTLDRKDRKEIRRRLKELACAVQFQSPQRPSSLQPAHQSLYRRLP